MLNTSKKYKKQPAKMHYKKFPWACANTKKNIHIGIKIQKIKYKNTNTEKKYQNQ